MHRGAGSRVWAVRAVGAAALLALVSACGFEPLYAQRDRGGVRDELASVTVAPIRDRSGQILRNQLVDQFRPNGQGGRSLYVLDVNLVEPREETALDRTDQPTRVIYTVIATYRLRDGATGATIFQGQSQASSSFNIDVSEFATLSGERNARGAVLRLLGEDISRQVGLFFSRRAKA